MEKYTVSTLPTVDEPNVFVSISLFPPPLLSGAYFEKKLRILPWASVCSVYSGRGGGEGGSGRSRSTRLMRRHGRGGVSYPSGCLGAVWK